MLSLIVGVGVAIGLIIYMLNLSNASADAISVIVNTVSSLMIQAFQWFVLLTPLIVIITPIWLLKDRETKDLLFGGLYGLLILFILNYMGLFGTIYGYFLSTGFNASLIGSLASFASNIYYFVVYLTGVLWSKMDRLVLKKLFGGEKKLKRRK